MIPVERFVPVRNFSKIIFWNFREIFAFITLRPHQPTNQTQTESLTKFSRQQDSKITFEFEMNASDFEEIIIPIYHTKVTPEIWLFEVILILIIVIGMSFSEFIIHLWSRFPFRDFVHERHIIPLLLKFCLFCITLRDNYLFFTLASCVKRKRKKAVSDRRNQLRIL